MGWDFEADPEYQEKLDSADEFIRQEVEPLDYVLPHEQFVLLDGARRGIIDPLAGPQGHLDGQGGHADGTARHRLAGDAGARCPRDDKRSAFFMMIHGRGGAGPGRRPDRGPQSDRRSPGVARLRRHGQHVAERVDNGKLESAKVKFADYLELEVGNL